jgi:hypothetical protein
MENLPFIEEKICDKVYVRTFSSDVLWNDLKWHIDEEDRIIIPVTETDWKFQRDNELPINIDGKIKIERGTWHRLIKGSKDLSIKVIKL